MRVDETGASARDIVVIPPQEIDNVVTLVLQRAGRDLSFSDIVYRANSILGYKRTGSRINGAYQQAIDRLMLHGTVIRTGDQYGIAP